MDARITPTENALLAALPAADYQRLRPYFSLVPLPQGKTLYEPGTKLRHIYFPVSSVVSLLYTMKDGRAAEIAIVGNEGCAGVAALLGDGITVSRALVEVGGYAQRASAEAIQEEFLRGGALQRLLLRYLYTLLIQVGQTAVCNRHHTVEQQICRWLLLTLDRVDSDHVVMTQELISNILGVRRSGITTAARKLQNAGLIEYRRGHITVPDRRKLEAHACECYAAVTSETKRLLALEHG